VRVIDASSLAKYVNREPNWREVEKYLLEGCLTIPLAVKESLYSIWKRVLKGELDKEQAYKVARGFIDNLMVRVVGQEDLYKDAFNISLNSNVTIYDAMYVALAKKLGLAIITSDKKQRDLAAQIGVPVVYIP